MTELPTGTVTFLFTDIEGSTQLLEALGDGYRAVQDRHDDILRRAIAAGDGVEVRTEGDAFFAVFPTATGAAEAVIAAQRALVDAEWPMEDPLRVRMGLHTGEGVLGGADYIGMDVHRAARIAAAAHGGQVLVSDATRALTAAGDGIELVDLGEHRFKGLSNPVRLYQLSASGLAAEFPPPRSLDARPNNLPDRLSSFVGRADEIDLIVRLLTDNRLVTLTGPGGTGKTRLALEVAATAMTDFSDGAFFVDLAAVTNPSFIALAAIDALGVRQRSDRPADDVLTEALGPMSVLLVLDNFEQVVEGAPVVAGLLQRAPAVKAMATSRIPLHIEGEQEVPIDPLDLPSLDQTIHLDELSEYEAIRLFVERAQAARPGFELSEDNARAVADIAVRLDGLPLAIELAASRVKLFSPPVLLDHLESSLPLAAKTKDLPERQRTLRSTIGWSYELLDADEARLFDRLGAFAGGADLGAVLAATADLPDPLAGVESLADKSLVGVGEGAGGRPRLVLLETIREFAAEKLADSEESDEVRRGLLEHWIELVESAEFVGPEAMTWIERLDVEQENIRAALQWALDHDEIEGGLRLSSALRYYTRSKGALAEGLHWLEAFLEASEGEPPSLPRARALTTAADLYSPGAGQKALNLARATDAVDAYRALGEEAELADALVELGYALMGSEQVSEANAALQEAEGIARREGNRQKLAEMQAVSVLVAMAEQRYDDAKERAEEAQEWFAENDPFFAVLMDMILGLLDGIDGRLDSAAERYRNTLSVYERLENPVALALALFGFADLALAEEEYGRAVELYSSFEAIIERTGTELPAFAEPLFGNAAEAARPHLEAAEFAEAWERGQARSYAEMLDDARAI